MSFFMNRQIKYFFFCIIFLFLSIFFAQSVAASGISVPTILSVDQSGGKIEKPLITGLTETGTKVSVLLDGEYLEDAKVNSGNTETDNFYYQFKKSIEEGSHIVSVLAQKGNIVSGKQDVEVIVSSLDAPTLVGPNKQSIIGTPKPFITGLTRSESFVHVYIDGVYNGRTEIVKHDSGTASFAYKPFLNLEVGTHKIWTIAEDLSGRKSKVSNILEFEILPKTPAPTSIQVLSNKDNTDRQPLVIGLVKNGLRARVYIDGKLNGEINIKGENEVVNFAYKPFVPLRDGSHMVYITAVDNLEKESVWSNIVYFDVLDKKQTPKISIEEDEEDVVVKSIEYSEDTEDDSSDNEVKKIKIEDLSLEDEVVNSEDNQNKKSGDDVSVDDILNQANSSESDSTSSDKETKVSQNLIVFILFLVAVIAWIFWVNRELIKEKKKEQDSSDK